MPEWLHDRAKHILRKNPDMPEGEAFAIATQQSHALGKTPKSYGTPTGKHVAKEKYQTPGDDAKTAAWRDKIPGGLSDKRTPKDFPAKSLRAGEKVEKEHTSDKHLQREISMDHLTEDPEYYAKLKKVEKDKTSAAMLSAFLDELPKTAALYHGSLKKLETLRSGTYVTPYKNDAAIFGVPWGSKDLTDRGSDPAGRPPGKLKFKGTPPKDHAIYIYKVDAKVKPADTNTGRRYAWNKVTTEEAPAHLVKTIPSWHRTFLETFEKKAVVRRAVKDARRIAEMVATGSHDFHRSDIENLPSILTSGRVTPRSGHLGTAAYFGAGKPAKGWLPSSNHPTLAIPRRGAPDIVPYENGVWTDTYALHKGGIGLQPKDYVVIDQEPLKSNPEAFGKLQQLIREKRLRTLPAVPTRRAFNPASSIPEAWDADMLGHSLASGFPKLKTAEAIPLRSKESIGALVSPSLVRVNTLPSPAPSDQEFGDEKESVKVGYAVSQYSGPLSMGRFKQESYLPPFNMPQLKTAGPPSEVGRVKRASEDDLDFYGDSDMPKIKQESHLPPFRAPALRRKMAGALVGTSYSPGKNVGGGGTTAGSGGAGGLLGPPQVKFSPGAQLAKSQNVAKVPTTPPGPTVATLAKPVGYGKPMPGATKTLSA